MKKRKISLFGAVLLILVLICSGCADTKETASSKNGSDGASGGGVFRSAEPFPYGTLDPHKDYNSWHSQKYGLTETLYRINDDMELEPWLAEDVKVDGQIAVITLKEGLCFSNGNPVTAQVVIDNFQRLVEVNNRFLYMGDWTMTAQDERTIQIDTGEPYPTLKNDLATPELCILDLEATTDFDLNPIATGSFVVEKFIPGGDITLVRNENYWDGDVVLDQVVFYAMGDDQAKLMAMQNGEIDGYDNLIASDIELFQKYPDKYDLYTMPMQTRGYAYLNKNKLPDSVREAIVLLIDREAISSFLPGVFTPSSTIFDEDLPYGKAEVPERNVEKAREIIEADGYELVNGVYTKNGQPLHIFLSCYAARNIDTVAILFQEQLEGFGILADIKLVEDPDGTYMTDHDFEICFYRSTTDKTGDPYQFLDSNVKSGSYGDIAGYGNAQTDALIEELRYEMDEKKRAELANEIMQGLYDSHTILVINSYNRNIVLDKGVTNFNETNPYEFYGVTAKTSFGS